MVEPHNPAWARKFVRESKLVTLAPKPAVVAIHYIGSTAISKIHAKPIIPMFVEVTDVQRDMRERWQDSFTVPAPS